MKIKIKIISIVAIMLSISVFSMVTCRAVDYRRYHFAGWQSTDETGEVCSIGQSRVLNGSTNWYYKDYTMADVDTFVDEDYNTVGFKAYMGDFPSGYLNSGRGTIDVFLGWVDDNGNFYAPSESDPYLVSYGSVSFNMFMFLEESNIKYPIQPDVANFYLDGVRVAYVTDFHNVDGYYNINFSYDTPLETKSDMSRLLAQIEWIGKPSNSLRPYLEFKIDTTGTALYATPLNVHINDSVGAYRDKVNNAIDKLDTPTPNINNINDVIHDNKESLDDVGSIMRGSGKFYTFLTSLCVVGVSVAVTGYILHGKRDG